MYLLVSTIFWSLENPFKGNTRLVPTSSNTNLPSSKVPDPTLFKNDSSKLSLFISILSVKLGFFLIAFVKCFALSYWSRLFLVTPSSSVVLKKALATPDTNPSFSFSVVGFIFNWAALFKETYSFKASLSAVDAGWLPGIIGKTSGISPVSAIFSIASMVLSTVDSDPNNSFIPLVIFWDVDNWNFKKLLPLVSPPIASAILRDCEFGSSFK